VSIGDSLVRLGWDHLSFLEGHEAGCEGSLLMSRQRFPGAKAREEAASARRASRLLKALAEQPALARLDAAALAPARGRPKRLWLRLPGVIQEAYAKSTAASKESHLQSFCDFMEAKGSCITESSRWDIMSWAQHFSQWCECSQQVMLNYVTSILDWLAVYGVLELSPQVLSVVKRVCVLHAVRTDPKHAVPFGVGALRGLGAAEKSALVLAVQLGLRASSLCSIQAHGVIRAQDGEVSLIVNEFKCSPSDRAVEMRTVKVRCNCGKEGSEFCLVHGELGLPDFPVERVWLQGVLDGLGLSLHSPRRSKAVALAIYLHEHPECDVRGMKEAVNAEFGWSRKSSMFESTYAKDYLALVGLDLLPVAATLESVRAIALQMRQPAGGAVQRLFDVVAQDEPLELADEFACGAGDLVGGDLLMIEDARRVVKGKAEAALRGLKDEALKGRQTRSAELEGERAAENASLFRSAPAPFKGGGGQSGSLGRLTSKQAMERLAALLPVGAGAGKKKGRR